MKRFFRFLGGAAVLLAGLSAPSARSEFLQTGPSVYQTLHDKIIVSQEVPGLFILTGGKRDIQLFDPAELPADEKMHVFIKYDPQQEKYTALLFGREEYRIRGSLSFAMGRLRIAIDNNNPYLTVTSDDDSNILGFQGLRQIVSAEGEAAIAFLEANQFNSYSEAVAPYLWRDGALWLKGTKAPATVGISLRPPENVCLLGSRVLYVTPEDLHFIKQAPTAPERSARLQNVLDKGSEREPFVHTLHLRIEKTAVISLNYQDGRLIQTSAMKSKFSSKTVCLVRELRF